MTDSLTIHLGRMWADALSQLRHVRTHESLYHTVSYVDLTRGAHTLFRVERPVRVLPLIFSWIDQLARASRQHGRSWVVGDGDELFTLTVHQDTVELRDDSQHARVILTPLLVALSHVLHLIDRDMERIASQEALLPLYAQLQRAHAVLERLMQNNPPRRHRTLHVASTLQAPEDREFSHELQHLNPPHELLERAPDCNAEIRARMKHIQLLEYEHQHVLRVASSKVQDVFFTDDDLLVLCTEQGAHAADVRHGVVREIPIPPPSKAERRAVRQISKILLYEDENKVLALHISARKCVKHPLHGARHTHRIKALVHTRDEPLAYLQGTTVFDAPTGVPLLHEVSTLIGRKDQEGRVVGWYALDHTFKTIWWDGEGEAVPLCTFEGACINMVAHPHGLIAHVLEDTRRTLRWIRPDGSLAWRRELPVDVPEFRRGGVLEVSVDPNSPDILCIHAIAAYRWWAFCVHRRTQLATMVLHHQENDAVRLLWTPHGLVCASGENLAVYPLYGRMPEPLWRDRVPKTLGVLAPVFPICAHQDLIAHASDEVVVRRAQDGTVLSTYRNDWTAIFDLRLTEAFDLIIAAAEPGQRIDLYHATPRHWLALVGEGGG